MRKPLVRTSAVWAADVYVWLLIVCFIATLLFSILMLVESLVEDLILSRYLWFGMFLVLSGLHAGLFLLFVGGGSKEVLSSPPYDDDFYEHYRIATTILCGSYFWFLIVLTIVTFVEPSDSRFKDYLQIQYIEFLFLVPAFLISLYDILSKHRKVLARKSFMK